MEKQNIIALVKEIRLFLQILKLIKKILENY